MKGLLNGFFLSRSVHVTKFLSSRTQLLSGSDDNSVKVWDIPAEKEIVTYAEHKVSFSLSFQSWILPLIATKTYDITRMLFLHTLKCGICILKAKSNLSLFSSEYINTCSDFKHMEHCH